MGNAVRFIRYSFRVALEPRHRHQRSTLKRYAPELLAGIAGGLVLSMPVWLILLGVI